MLFQKIKFTLIAIILCLSSYAQTDIDNYIRLISVDSSLRQINNLSVPVEETDAIRLEDVKYGKYNYAAATGSDTIQLLFDLPFSKLVDGDLFFFTMPTLTGSKFILSNTNMDTLFPLMINETDTVKTIHIQTGQIIAALYYKNRAFVISPISKTCPQGFVKVNENYCIEINENTALNFHQASSTCINKNAELCNYAEWYYACQNGGTLGLMNMTNNYEWIDDATNEDLQVKVVGSTYCYIMANLTSYTTTRNYRCCYSLK